MLNCISNVYNTNDTMRMLGKQCSYEIISEEQFKKLNDIATARPSSFTKEAAIDIFMLGYIYGKKAERSRKAKRGTC